MITVLLIKKIISLFIMLFAGAALVRLKVFSASESRTLSKCSLYLLAPCMILTAFQVDYSPEVTSGLALAAGASVIIQVLLVVISHLIKKPLHLDAVEHTSIIYSNAGNLIVPLVSAILGDEWVIYTSGFMGVQLFLMWTHGKSILCGDTGIDIKKILLNPNMLSIFVGLMLFFTGLRIPGPVGDAVDSLGDMIGPVSMLVTGMLIGGMDLKKLFSYKRLPFIMLMRLIAVPLFVFAILRFTGIANLAPNGRDVLLITFLACMTPSASTITNMAVVYDRDADYASAINVATTLGCIITMPLMVALYTM